MSSDKTFRVVQRVLMVMVIISSSSQNCIMIAAIHNIVIGVENSLKRVALHISYICTHRCRQEADKLLKNYHDRRPPNKAHKQPEALSTKIFPSALSSAAYATYLPRYIVN
jgi:hypothetical protein